MKNSLFELIYYTCHIETRLKKFFKKKQMNIIHLIVFNNAFILTEDFKIMIFVKIIL